MAQIQSYPGTEAPVKGDFFRDFVRGSRPVIIRGLTSDWGAHDKWSLSFLAEQYGNIPIGNIVVKNGECDFNMETGSHLRFQSLQDTINIIASGNIQNGLAVATPTDVFPESIHGDYSPPAYCSDGEYLRDRIFLGARGTVTSLHQDLFENLYTMVRGTKRITLYAPGDNVYPNSRFSKLPNHAQTDPENPDYKRFPGFASATPYVVDLKAGETLYIPSLWWHHLRNMEESIAVSHWWAYGWKRPIVWAAATYKKLRKI